MVRSRIFCIVLAVISSLALIYFSLQFNRFASVVCGGTAIAGIIGLGILEEQERQVFQQRSELHCQNLVEYFHCYKHFQ